MPPSIPYLASLILCRNRKSGKQDIPELRLQSGTALRAYLAKLRLDCHTSLADGSLPALAEAVPQTPLQAREVNFPILRLPLRGSLPPFGRMNCYYYNRQQGEIRYRVI